MVKGRSQLCRARRIALPFGLLALGVWLLNGCIYIPTFNRTVEGKNLRNKVGSAHSHRPVKIGVSTAHDVVRELGKPYRQTEDGRVLCYTWKTQAAATVWPLCFDYYSIDRWQTLVLRFNDKGVLSSSEVLTSRNYMADYFFYYKHGITGESRSATVPLPNEFMRFVAPTTRASPTTSP